MSKICSFRKRVGTVHTDWLVSLIHTSPTIWTSCFWSKILRWKVTCQELGVLTILSARCLAMVHALGSTVDSCSPWKWSFSMAIPFAIKENLLPTLSFHWHARTVSSSPTSSNHDAPLEKYACQHIELWIWGGQVRSLWEKKNTIRDGGSTAL